MKKKTPHKPRLDREVVRPLSKPDLELVIGGGKQPTVTGNCY